MAEQDGEPTLTSPPGAESASDAWRAQHDYEKLAVEKWKARTARETEAAKLFGDIAKSAASVLILVNGGATLTFVNLLLRNFDSLNNTARQLASLSITGISFMSSVVISCWATGVFAAAMSATALLSAVDENKPALNRRNIKTVRRHLWLSAFLFWLGIFLFFGFFGFTIFRVEPRP